MVDSARHRDFSIFLALLHGARARFDVEITLDVMGDLIYAHKIHPLGDLLDRTQGWVKSDRWVKHMYITKHIYFCNRITGLSRTPPNPSEVVSCACPTKSGCIVPTDSLGPVLLQNMKLKIRGRQVPAMRRV